MPLPKVIRRADQQREELAKLYNQIQEANTKEDADTLIAGIINNQTDLELARLITSDEHMLATKHKIRLLSYQPDPVLITGPSGTGKEILAKALHGSRPPHKFYALNCAGMPEELIESELFGHVAGSFTGAICDREGIFRAAHDGTVLLDEIAEAPLALQAKLLRVLQPNAKGKYVIRPVGGSATYEINCRIVASTCKDLEHCMSSGTFREDLYGRLMTFELTTTSLLTRPSDITLILSHLGITDLAQQADILQPYWQQRVARFNVRALQAFARRTKVLI